MRRSTVVYLVIFAGMIGLYFFLKSHPLQSADNGTPTETTTPIAYLFQPTDGVPNNIRIESKAGEIVEMVRNADTGWAVVQPTEAAADQGAAEAAASQVSTMRTLDRLKDVDPSAVGLDNPEYTLTLKFSSGMERIVEIGVLTPTEAGYYVRDVDGSIVIVSKSSVDALLELLTNPPFAATETPLPITPEAVTPGAVTATPQP